MSATQKRIELSIDVFELPQQKALVLPAMKPSDLVRAILDEFQEIEYLGKTTSGYHLVTEQGNPLDDTLSLEKQVRNQSCLVLVEKEVAMPQNTQPMKGVAYLREQTSGYVYRLFWQPSIIGRRVKNQSNNALVAVDLSDEAAYPTGARVSRRHAQVVEQGGQYYLESLSQNPTIVEDGAGNKTPLNGGNHPLNHGDSILLENSGIRLKFIVRNGE
jgi:hypothetical protein